MYLLVRDCEAIALELISSGCYLACCVILALLCHQLEDFVYKLGLLMISVDIYIMAELSYLANVTLLIGGQSPYVAGIHHEIYLMVVFMEVVNEKIQPNSYTIKCKNLQKPTSACYMAFC